MTDSKKKRTRRSFSEEFKREAVELFQGSGVSAEQVSAETGHIDIVIVSVGCATRATIRPRLINPVTRN